jgi:hypothetical protein
LLSIIQQGHRAFLECGPTPHLTSKRWADALPECEFSKAQWFKAATKTGTIISDSKVLFDANLKKLSELGFTVNSDMSKSL